MFNLPEKGYAMLFRVNDLYLPVIRKSPLSDEERKTKEDNGLTLLVYVKVSDMEKVNDKIEYTDFMRDKRVGEYHGRALYDLSVRELNFVTGLFLVNSCK